MRAFTRAHVCATAIAIAAAAGLTAACGNWQAPSPIGPSNLPGAAVMPPAPSSGSTISGTIGSVNGVRRFGTAAAASTNIVVTIVGTDKSTTVDFFGRFVFQGAPSGSIQLHFSGPGVDATLNVGFVQDREQIDLEVNLRASSATVQSSIRIAADNTTQVEGPVASVTGTCPNLSIQVHGFTLNLSSTSQSTCDSIKVGIRIRINGHRESTNTIVVVRIEVNTPKPPETGDDHDDDDR